MNQVVPVGARSALRTNVLRSVAFPSSRDSASVDAIASVLTAASDIGTATERFEEGFVAAVRLYERGSWPRAFEQLTKLADDGNAPAAKLALLMLRYGSTLYGTSFSAQPTQIARWAQYVLGLSVRAIRDRR